MSKAKENLHAALAAISPESPAKELQARRQILGTLGAASVGMIVGCGGDTSSGSSGSGSGSGSGSFCTLTAEQEEGPFYVALETIRQDISEGRPGAPLALQFTVIDTTTCAPLANAAVDIWHCDTAGVYSAVEAEGAAGDTYLRGVQLTDSEGKVTFTTIYPGWYPGRTIHVHVKVHVGGSANGSTYGGGHVSHTGNVFFPQEYDDQITTASPYTENTATLTKNANDMVWKNQNGSGSVLTVSGSADAGFAASITLGVDSTATPARIGITSSGGTMGGRPPRP